MLNFVCANDINSREIIDKLAEMMNGKQSLYLTATQSIKKLRKESAILSSYLHENIYSITEFIQVANKEVYATEDVLSVADSRYILSKVIGYKFANDQDKYRLYYEMRYDIFELFRTLIFHEKSVSEKGIAEIGHDFSCFEEDLFDLYKTYEKVLSEVLKMLRGTDADEYLYEVLGDNFLKDKKSSNIDLFVNKQKEIIEEMVCDYDLVIFDGFLFFDDMQKYIIKKACENDIPVCFVAKVLDKGVSNFLLEDNFKKLAEELDEEIIVPEQPETSTDVNSNLQYFRTIYPEIKESTAENCDGSIRVCKPFINREEELRFVVADISAKLKEQYNGDIEQLVRSVNNDFAIVTGIEKEKYQERIANLFREIGVFVFKGRESLENAGYGQVDDANIKEVYFDRNDFLNTEIAGLEYSDKYQIFEKCFSRIQITKKQRPIATYPIGQFIIEIYRIIAEGMSVDGFKTILFSNWKYTMDKTAPMWSRYISDFKYIENFVEKRKTVADWIKEIESLKEVKERIADNPMYVYHPIKQIDAESLEFFLELLNSIDELCRNIGSVEGSIEKHLEALKGLLSSAQSFTQTPDEDLEFEQVILKRIINAIDDIGHSSLMNNINAVYFAENIRYMINEWEQQNEEEDNCRLRLNVVNLENMQQFKHSYFIMVEAEKYPRHYRERFPYNKDIMTILTEPKYEIGVRSGEVRGLEYHLKLEKYLFKNVLDFTTDTLTITSAEKEGSRHTSESIYVKDLVKVFGDEIRQGIGKDSDTTEYCFEGNIESEYLPKEQTHTLVELAIFKLCPRLYYHMHKDENKGVYLNSMQLKFYAEAVLFCDVFKRFMEYNLENKVVYKAKEISYQRIVEQVAEGSFAEHLQNFSFLREYEIKDLKNNVINKIIRFIEGGKNYLKGKEFTIIPYWNKTYQGNGYELVIEHDNRYVDYNNRTFRMSQNGTYLEFLIMKTSEGKSKLVHYKDMIDALDRNDENEDRINLTARIISKINIQFDSKRFAGDGIKRTDALVGEVYNYDFSKAEAMKSNFCNYCRFRDICMQR